MSSAFASEFARTLADAPKELDDNYEGTHGRPVTFSEMPVTFEAPDSDTAPAPLQISLKSIRSPKFQLEYTVPRTDTIFAVKERLLSDSNGPVYGSQYTPANIKLLLKAKVIGDTRQLLELPSVDFTVMFVTATESIDVPVPAQVYWGARAETKDAATQEVKPATPAESAHAAAAAAATTAATAASQKPGLTTAFWQEIEAVAQRYVEDASALVDQFKAASAGK